MAATTYISLDVALTITTAFEPGSPKQSLHSTSLFILTSIWPAMCVSLPRPPVLCMAPDVTLPQRSIPLLYPNGVDRGPYPPRDAPFGVLFSGRYPFYPRTACLLSPFSHHLRWFRCQ